jgi:hypothetical protein
MRIGQLAPLTLRGACLVLVHFVAACASTQTTPQQDYTYAMGRNCETPTTKIERVAPDGRYWIQAHGIGGSTSAEYQRFFACMKEQFQAHPFLDWAKAQKREATQPPSAVGSIEGEPKRVSTNPMPAPVWKVGDEWQYAYKSPTDSGSYVWKVDRLESLDGDAHYVIKTGTREILYRVSDFATTLERVNGVVVLRETPSRHAFDWPLAVGKSWEQSHRQERPVDRTTMDRQSVWTVDAEEVVTVPAGTFQSLKITWRNKNSGALLSEMWIAPDAKQMVKLREILSNGERVRELMSFKVT